MRFKPMLIMCWKESVWDLESNTGDDSIHGGRGSMHGDERKNESAGRGLRASDLMDSVNRFGHLIQRSGHYETAGRECAVG